LSCSGKRKCSHCKRHLCDALYEDPMTRICKACARKLAYSGVRTTEEAFGSILREHSLHTSEEDTSDLQAYVRNHQDDIRDILRQDVEDHRYVSSLVCTRIGL
jgi:hypothetical protein